MHGLYPNDASMLDTAGRLLIVALFLIIGIRNLQKFHVDDHIARLTKFKAPFPKLTFWIGQTMEFAACAMVLFNWHADIGVIAVLIIQMGILSPPVGLNVFIVKGIVPDVPMYTIFRGIWPFWYAMGLLIVMLLIFPQLALFLPNTMFR